MIRGYSSFVRVRFQRILDNRGLIILVKISYYDVQDLIRVESSSILHSLLQIRAEVQNLLNAHFIFISTD